MAVHPRPVKIVEIDIDRCTRTFGTSPCMAALGGKVVRKCYNTFSTCAYTQAYAKGTNTLKFIEATYNVKGGNYFPVLTNVSGWEQEVNIAGYTSDMGGIGKRAVMEVTLRDFPYRDTLTDKYWDQRISGAAQTDEAGYDPLERGSFFTKFFARNPNYAGRPLRIIEGHIDDAGEVVYDTIRSYVMDSFSGPDSRGNFSIKVKDILSLADDKKALAPVASAGRLLLDINAEQRSFTLSPSGIGAAEYPAAGVITVGSEIMTFMRSGDVMNVTRGQRNTSASSHNANDTVQLAFDVVRLRADEVIRRLFINYGNIPASYINFAEWQAEFDQWGNQLVLTATICKPTGVSSLIGEISLLGMTVWWDDVAQKIRLMLNHPPEEVPVNWSDRNNIIKIGRADNDEERATRIEISTVQIDPTKDLSKDNFQRVDAFISVDSESPFMYGLPRTQQILCRWLNHGAASVVKINGMRLLNRYKRAPEIYTVTVDEKDDVSLAQVVSLTSHVNTDITGKEIPKLMQTFSRKSVSGNKVDVKLQMFQFDQRYGKIAPNNYPLYNSATEAQKLHGSWFAGPSLVFADGAGPYQFI